MPKLKNTYPSGDQLVILKAGDLRTLLQVAARGYLGQPEPLDCPDMTFTRACDRGLVKVWKAADGVTTDT